VLRFWTRLFSTNISV